MDGRPASSPFVIFGVNVAGVRDVDFLTAQPNAIDVMIPIANLTQGLQSKRLPLSPPRIE
jgi:hypothetical protein